MSHDRKPAEPEPPKDEVDWDIWLGPCPWRPYHSSYVSGSWRGYYDFHTSCIGEWGAHTFAQAQAGIDALDTSPVDYQYVNNPTGDGMVTTFANGVKMVLSRGEQNTGMARAASASTARMAGSPRPTAITSRTRHRRHCWRISRRWWASTWPEPSAR